MKKIIVVTIVVCALILAACSGNDNDKKYANDPVYQRGKILVASNDCLICHEIDKSATGPAYTDVANKYANTEANIDMLAQKIMSGGSGHWGTTPMAAHPNVSMDDAKTMVHYILLLKTK